MSPLVSIITPTFNSASYIAETIQSVQNQSYTNWEMIIVDDCSTDATLEIIKKIQETEPRIQLHTLQKNSGSGIARNTGIKQAKGKYLTFLDADDLWMQNSLEVRINFIKNNKKPFVYSSYKNFDEINNVYKKDFIAPSKVNYSDVLKSNSIGCLTVMIDIETLGKKYMPSIRKRQDMGLWVQYLKEIPYAYGIQEPLATYRIRQNSLSRKKTDLIKFQWEFYRNVEGLSVVKSTYYLLNWMIRGYLKYRN